MVLLVILVLEAHSQSSIHPPVRNERDLISAIANSPAGQVGGIRELLIANQNLVSPGLYDEVSRLAMHIYYSNSGHAINLLRAAVEVALLLDDSPRIAAAFYRLGRAYSGAYKIDEAIEAFIISQAYFDSQGNTEEAINVSGDLALNYLYKRDFERARQDALWSFNLHGSSAIDDLSLTLRSGDYGIALSLWVLAFLDSRDGNHNQAINYYQKACALFQRLDKGSLRYGYYLAESLSGLGRVYYQAGDNLQALVLFEKALDVARRALQKSRIASVLNDMGVLFLSQQDYVKAMDYFSQSLQTYRSLNNKLETARLEYNLGIAHQRSGNYEQALDLCQSSQNHGREGQFVEIMIVAGEGLSTIHRERGNYVKALEELDASETLARSANEKYLLAEILWLKAKVYQAAQRNDEASAAATAAIFEAKQVNAQNISYLAYTTLGQCYLAQKMFDPARQNLSRAVKELEGVRTRIAGREYERQLFFEQKIAPYNSMIDLLVMQKRPVEALLFAEKAKARTLIDVLSQGRTDLFRAMTLEERQEEKRLNHQIMNINRLLRDESLSPRPEMTKINKLSAELTSARSSYSSFQARVFSLHHDSSGNLPPSKEINESDLKNVLRNTRTAILEYVVRENGVYLFVITKRPQSPGIKVNAYDIAIDKKALEEKVMEFHRMIANRDLLFSPKAREIYDLLIKPAETEIQGKTTLCFIPDGVLWNVPFQATQVMANRFLIEDYAIYYTPSLSALKILSAPPRMREMSKASTLISLANPSVKRGAVSHLEATQRAGNLEPLPEAEIEVKKIEKLFLNNWSKTFTGEAATESSFKSLASKYDIIHLATHGILDNQHPLYSYLLFSDDGSEQEDGMLEAREVMNLDLNADLVVLSACETARGSIKRGEGVVGMSWAFLVAGSKATVVSQWKVNSASTAQFMVNFYRHLLGSDPKVKTTKSQALRRAALGVLKAGHYGHPYYWASFIILGNGG